MSLRASLRLLICRLLSPWLLPVTPTIGVPPAVRPDDAPDDRGDDAPGPPEPTPYWIRGWSSRSRRLGPAALRPGPDAGVGNAGWGLVKDANRPGSDPAGQTTPPAPDALRPGSDTATENAGLGAGEKRNSPRVLFRGERKPRKLPRREMREGTQSAQGVMPGKLLRGGNGGERSTTNGRVVSYRPDGNCVATVSVRSDAAA